MTAAGRMLRAVRDELTRNAHIQGERLFRLNDGEPWAIQAVPVGDVPPLIREPIDRIRSAATLCPRCGHEGLTDCACPEMSK